MQCKWEYDDSLGKFKCINCGFVVPRASLQHRCKMGESHAQDESLKDHAQIPSMGKRIMNFGKAAVNHVITGMHKCSDTERQHRLEICQRNKCGLFKKHNQNSSTGVCSHDDCGCFLRSNRAFLDKLSWAESECPVGLWGKAEPESPENPENGV